jgi:EAL domain-containing protein (putative c-di-GMP-specific phosphodiesterase class I)/CheY-like chemotaxis protein
LSPGEQLTVLVADEPGEVRESLTELLEGAPDMRVAAVAANAAEALRLSCIHRPSAVLVGGRLPGDAMSAIREIRQAVPGAAVLAYAEEAEPAGVQEAVEAGATSYLVAGHRGEAMLDALRHAAAGRSTLSPAAATAVVQQLGVSPAGMRERRIRARRRSELERFIRGDGLTVALQPVFDLGSGAVVAVEALARFDTGALESPSLWFARAAEEGVGAELELAALRAGLRVLGELPTEMSLALNVSPHIAAGTAFGELIAAVPAERIILELTEHAAVEDYAELALAFAALRDRGVRIAVDDAGAGFASLRHVLMIEPDYLKLDISLCAGVARDRRRRALARALLGFARETDIRTIAEGIECDEDLDALAELGVEYAQGYHLAPPASLDELSGLAHGLS